MRGNRARGLRDSLVVAQAVSPAARKRIYPPDRGSSYRRFECVRLASGPETAGESSGRGDFQTQSLRYRIGITRVTTLVRGFTSYTIPPL